jgi:uncharacterized protein YggT (Ycf19 family)
MGELSASGVVLGDTIDRVASFLQVFAYLYMILIFGYILLSWIRVPYSPWLSRIQRFLYDVCEPYLRLFRRILPPLGPLDLSPVVAVIVLNIALQLALYGLNRLH